MDHIGSQCYLCKKQDFLPFKCDACNQTFCAEHRSYEAHNCQIGLSPAHQNVKSTANTKPVERCPVPGCKTKLNLSNRFTCDKCGVTVCLKHRYEDDHNCTGVLLKSSKYEKPAPNCGPAPMSSVPNQNNRNQNQNNQNLVIPQVQNQGQQGQGGTGSNQTNNNGGDNKKKKKGLFGILCGCVGGGKE